MPMKAFYFYFFSIFLKRKRKYYGSIFDLLSFVRHIVCTLTCLEVVVEALGIVESSSIFVEATQQ